MGIADRTGFHDKAFGSLGEYPLLNQRLGPTFIIAHGNIDLALAVKLIQLGQRLGIGLSPTPQVSFDAVEIIPHGTGVFL